MEYNKLNKHYFEYCREDLPFEMSEFSIQGNESEVSSKLELINYYELRYESKTRTKDNQLNLDFNRFLMELKKFEGDEVSCLLVLAKKHFLTFVFDDKKSKLISVFPINKWRELSLRDSMDSSSNSPNMS